MIIYVDSDRIEVCTLGRKEVSLGMQSNGVRDPSRRNIIAGVEIFIDYQSNA